MILQFSNNCNKQLIPLLESFGKFITVPSILIYLLNHNFKEDFLKEKFELNLKEGPNALFD